MANQGIDTGETDNYSLRDRNIYEREREGERGGESERGRKGKGKILANFIVLFDYFSDICQQLAPHKILLPIIQNNHPTSDVYT